MASLYTRPGSRYYWIKYRDQTGKVKMVSSKCRIGVGPEVRRAQQMAAEKTVEELKSQTGRRKDEGWSWVHAFLSTRYATSPATLERYMDCWSALKLFIQERELMPVTFSRQHCFEYIGWRAAPDKEKGKYNACLNTALLDLKILRIILQEAVVRNLIQGNPCVKLGIKKARPKEKPELTEEECTTIRAAAKRYVDPVVREMLVNSFEIARYQGCRIKETRLNPHTDVDLDRQTIRFRSKGGRDQVTLLHPALIPFFKRLRRDKSRRSTWDAPEGAGRQWASAKWWKFLDRLGMKDQARTITFHCTRVTVVTEMARNDVPENKAQAFVGHSSTIVHRVYQRLRAGDLDDCVRAVGRKSLSSSKSDSSDATPPPH